MNAIERITRKIRHIGRLMYEKNLVAGNSGNISCRIDDNAMLITASGTHKGMLTADDIIACDMNGTPAGGHGSGRRLSSEFKMHQYVYRNRPDIRAVVHAHPSYVLALTLPKGTGIDAYLPETVLAAGRIGIAEYATPTTSAVVRSIQPLVAKGYNNIVLHRHGTLNLSDSLETAFLHLEVVEHTAKVIAIARSIGGPGLVPLPEAEMAELARLAGAVQTETQRSVVIDD